jgi:hypothetical protein
MSSENPRFYYVIDPEVDEGLVGPFSKEQLIQMIGGQWTALSLVDEWPEDVALFDSIP